MEKQLIDEKFFLEHQVKQNSAQYHFHYEYMQNLVNTQNSKISHEDMLSLAEIKSTNSPEVLIRYMRRKLSEALSVFLRQEITQKEELILEEAKERAITNKSQVFIENFAYMLMKGEYNPAAWIREVYDQVENEYMKSLLCLVLGKRGEAADVPFLMDEVKRFEKDYDGGTYEQGPLLALYQLNIRYNRIMNGGE